MRIDDAIENDVFGREDVNQPADIPPPPDRDKIALFRCPVCETLSAPQGECQRCGCAAVAVYSDQNTPRYTPRTPAAVYQIRYDKPPGWSVRYLPKTPIKPDDVDKLFILKLYCPRCAKLLTENINAQPYCATYCRLFVMPTSRPLGESTPERDPYFLIKVWHRQYIQTSEAIKCMTLNTYYQQLDHVCAQQTPVLPQEVSPEPVVSSNVLQLMPMSQREKDASYFVSTFLVACHEAPAMPHDKMFEALQCYVSRSGRTLPVNRVDKDILLRLVRKRFPQPENYRKWIKGKQVRCLVGLRMSDAFKKQFGDV